MLRWIENRLGWLAVPNVTLFLICGQILTFLVAALEPAMWDRIVLVPRAVLQGEVWRLLTFLFLAPVLDPARPVFYGVTILFFIIYLHLFWRFGTALEQQWGTLRYNVFLLVGFTATVGTSFFFPATAVTNGFIYTTVFLAFAYLYPDYIMLLFFILPIRIKWLALVAWLGVGFLVLVGTLPVKVAAVASVANFLLFFSADLYRRLYFGARRIKRKTQAAVQGEEAFHRCVVCGRTDQTDAQLEFRYARTPNGVQCFCVDHLPPPSTG